MRPVFYHLDALCQAVEVPICCQFSENLYHEYMPGFGLGRTPAAWLHKPGRKGDARTGASLEGRGQI